MQESGRWLVIAGVALAAVGALLWSGFGRGWLGQLPGDIRVSRDGFSIHFPLMTCVVLSVVLSLLLWFFRK